MHDSKIITSSRIFAELHDFIYLQYSELLTELTIAMLKLFVLFIAHINLYLHIVYMRLTFNDQLLTFADILKFIFVYSR